MSNATPAAANGFASRATVTVTVDGRTLAVPAGSTLLEAARLAGVRVPALCWMAGVPAPTSCFVCVVQVEGRRDLAPACVTAVADGLVLHTHTEEVRTARRTALELLLSDHVGECEAPCTLACPAGLDIPRFLAATAGGDPAAAFAAVVERIPLAASLGRVCPRYCERACRRGDVDEPVAICALKRHAWESGLATAARPPLPLPPATGKRVAVVGGGPAGLTAAWFIRRCGHACTVFEAEPEVGGRFRWAIPAFRLPAAVVRDEADLVSTLGVEVRTGWRLDSAARLAELRSSFDAVLLATGAGATPDLPGTAAGAVPTALAFLRQVAAGERPAVGRGAVVVGHGNEAVDAARTLLRLGAGTVTLVGTADWTAFPGLLDAAKAEGVATVAGAQLLAAWRHANAWQVRVDVAGTVTTLPGDTLLNGLPREADAEFAHALGLPERHGRVTVKRGTWATDEPGLFAIGELTAGPTAAVRATAAARPVACAIDQFLRGLPVTGEPAGYNHRLGSLSDEEKARFTAHAQPGARATPTEAAPDSRVASFAEIAAPLEPEAARREAQRCLQCACRRRQACGLRDLAAEYGASQSAFAGERREWEQDRSHPQVVYESGKCILCGRCVALAEAAGGNPGLSLSARGFRTRVRVPFGGRLAEALPEAVLQRCVAACPTGALVSRESTG